MCMILVLLCATFPFTDAGSLEVKADTATQKVLVVANGYGTMSSGYYPNTIMQNLKTFYESEGVDCEYYDCLDALKGNLSSYSLVILSVGPWGENIPISDADAQTYADNINAYAKAGGCALIVFEYESGSSGGTAANTQLRKVANAMGHQVECGTREYLVGSGYIEVDPDSALASQTGNHYGDSLSYRLTGNCANELFTTNSNAKVVGTYTDNNQVVHDMIIDIPFEEGYVTYIGDVSILTMNGGGMTNGNKWFALNLLERSEESIQAAAHEHVWVTRLGTTNTCDDTIEAYCTYEDGNPCHFRGEDNATSLVLVAEDMVYDEDAYDLASLEIGTAFPGSLTEADIHYCGSGTTVYADSTTPPTEVGTYRASITYDGKTAVADFAITESPITVTASAVTATYDGAGHQVNVSADVTGVTIEYRTEDTDFTSENPSFTEAGIYTVYYRVSKPGYATATGSTGVTIEKKQIAASVTASDKVYDRTTEATLMAEVDVADLVAGDSLTIQNLKGSFENRNAGENKTVTVDASSVVASGDGASNYALLLPAETTATIYPKPITTDMFSLNGEGVDHTSYVFSGESISPVVTGFDVDEAMTENTDYGLSGDLSGQAAGRYGLHVTGTGNYTGTLELDWGIATDLILADVTGYRDYYDGQAHGLTIQLKKPVSGAVIYYGTSEESCLSTEPLRYTEIGTYLIYYRIEADNYEAIQGQAFVIILPGGNVEKEITVDEEAPIESARLVSETDDLIEADGIFTAEEKEEIRLGKNARVWVEISSMLRESIGETDAQAMEEAAAREMEAEPSISYFDATLYKQMEDGAVCRIHEPGTEIAITIEIPEELLNHDRNLVREYKIIRLHEGSVDVISGVFDEESREFTFETDRFSTYAIAYCDLPREAEDTTVALPKLGDMDDRILYYLILIAGILATIEALRCRE